MVFAPGKAEAAKMGQTPSTEITYTEEEIYHIYILK
jgi:hypothetical protein|tara:strand:+ start:720 stop:827 length:108 start_codon:yes stop_codon:yes gene_type:complete